VGSLDGEIIGQGEIIAYHLIQHGPWPPDQIDILIDNSIAEYEYTVRSKHSGCRQNLVSFVDSPSFLDRTRLLAG